MRQVMTLATDDKQAGVRARKPRPVNAARIEAAALHYLERFASSAASLRRVLMRRVRRSAALHGTDPAEGAAIVEALIQRYLGNGLLDDAAYARARAAGLHRRGKSARAIQASLAAKGIDRSLIAAATGEERPGGDLAAAAALVRRRRLGPYRQPEDREAYRQKDLGTMARAGFSRQIACSVLDAADAEALAGLLDEAD
jgi:regulatory protein